MNNQNAIFLVVAFLVINMLSCSKQETLNDELVSITSEESLPIVSQTKLGKKIDNPFTVENMQKAYNNLVANGTVTKQSGSVSEKKEVSIQASHYYYRFLPKDSTQYLTLVNDEILDIENEPLDYEIEESGEGYFDPSLDSSLPYSYQYSIFPADYDFPTHIKHEKLEEMYFPLNKEDEISAKQDESVYLPLDKTSKNLRENGSIFLDMLETEAIKIAGGLDDDELESYDYIDSAGKKVTYKQIKDNGLDLDTFAIDYSDYQNLSLTAKKWNPNGKVTVLEDALSTKRVGVAGAEIKIRKWGLVVIKKTRTDANGNFKSSSTRTKNVKYAVYFNSQPWFRINQGTILVEARHRGTTSYRYGSWNQYFSSGRAHLYSLIQNAAYEYHTKWIPKYSLRRPRFCEIKAVYDNDKSSQHRPAVFSGIVSDIRVTRIRNGAYRGSDGIFATTVHELTHAGHREMDPGIFSIVAGSCRRDILTESWAEGVETIITNERYDSFRSSYFSDTPTDFVGWNSGRQREEASEMTEYTPIVIDLIDQCNQNKIVDTSGEIRPIDNVSGYTLSTIQSALNGSRYQNTWRDKLNNSRPSGVTTAELNQLFAYTLTASCD